MVPENIEERIVWTALVWTYPLYFVGALYLSGPIVGWLLLMLLVLRFVRAEKQPRIPLFVWLWCVGMLVMLISLVVGHVLNNLGTVQLIKSAIGWGKGWALLAIFIIAGTQHIRPELLVRGAMHVCLHTLVLLPVFVGAWVLGLPETAYVSPLKVIGGPGPEFFAVSLYEIDPGSGLPRWRLFTPWAPALGFVANIFFLLSRLETNAFWRRTGVSSSVIMILMSQSRLALVALILMMGLLWAWRRLSGPAIAFCSAAGAFLFAFTGGWILQRLELFYGAIKAARADSTRVRETLARIALQRWQEEAPIWGHGVVERGPHLVEYMPIGSHHSWYGLLFVKGVVGLLALAVPLIGSVCALTAAGASLPCRVAACCALLLLAYTFGENLEILAYLIWPGLVMMGIGHRMAAEAKPKALSHTHFAAQLDQQEANHGQA